jgi:hypothetical protein
MAADRERAERVAVIAHPPGDEMAALRLAALDEVLARELERDLHRFRAAADERDASGAEARGASATSLFASCSVGPFVKNAVCA